MERKMTGKIYCISYLLLYNKLPTWGTHWQFLWDRNSGIAEPVLLQGFSPNWNQGFGWPKPHLKFQPRRRNTCFSAQVFVGRIVSGGLLDQWTSSDPLLPSGLCQVLAWGHPQSLTTQTSPTWQPALSKPARDSICWKSEATALWNLIMEGTPFNVANILLVRRN